MPRRAYSYLRFSTPEQRLGDSQRRQIDGAKAWCDAQKPPVILDNSLKLHDRGVGGFRQRTEADGKDRVQAPNERKGALGKFLDALRNKRVEKGSILLIESLDRLTRIEPLDALDLFREIIRSGVELVTLEDGQRYTGTSIREIGQLIGALVIMSRAHNESASKAKRLGASWVNKRALAETSSRPMTRRVPAWIRVVGVVNYGQRHDWANAKFELIPERVEILKDIFTRTAKGWGRRRITRWLNERGIEPWGEGKRKAKGGWQESYIHKLLTFRSVLGEYQPHKLSAGRYSPRVPVGNPIPNFYPAAIPESLWHAAQATRSGPAKPRGRPSGALLTSLLIDPDGARMHVERKGDNCNYYSTALAYRRSGKRTHIWRMDHLDKCVLMLVQDIDWSVVLTDSAGVSELAILRGQLIDIDREEAKLKQQTDRAARMLLEDLGALGDAIRQQADEFTKRKAELAAKRSETQSRIDAIESTARAAESDALKKPDLNSPEAIQRLNGELRRLIKSIQVWPDGGSLDLPSDEREVLLASAMADLTGNRGLYARMFGRVFGALRFTFSTGKAVTVLVTYRPAARVNRNPEVLGFTQPTGWTLDDWYSAWKHVGWENVLERARFAPADEATAALKLSDEDYRKILKRKQAVRADR